jgi:hypothetical protein
MVKSVIEEFKWFCVEAALAGFILIWIGHLIYLGILKISPLSYKWNLLIAIEITMVGFQAYRMTALHRAVKGRILHILGLSL